MITHKAVNTALRASVGRKGINNPHDVKIVQNLLNQHRNAKLKVDGVCGPLTILAIDAFQKKFMHVTDATVDHGGLTWKMLHRNPTAAPVPFHNIAGTGAPKSAVYLPTATMNHEGLRILKESESKHPDSPPLMTYVCPAGKLTIGWGHTGPDVTGFKTITKAEAENLLKQDISKFEKGVRHLVKVPISSNQFSALVSFAFNLGLDNLKHSTLLKKLNQGDYEEATHQFPLWVHGGGRVLPGLVTRREKERALFLKPNENAPGQSTYTPML